MRLSKKMLGISFVIIVLLFFGCSDDGGIAGANNGGTTGSVGDISFFDPLQCHEIKIQITTNEWSNLSNDLQHTMYSDNPNRNGKLFSTEIYRHASLLVNGIEIKDVGVRVRGNTSRFFPRDADGFHWVHWKISFSQDFAENEDVYGSAQIPTILKTTKIHFGTRGFILKHHADDASGVKEALGYDIAARFGVMVPKVTFAKVVVSVDGTEYDYGLYQVIEPIDKQFIRTRFSGFSSYLFKCLWNKGGPATLQTGIAGGATYSLSRSVGMEVKDPTNASQVASWNPKPDYPSTETTIKPYAPTYDLKAKKKEFTTAAGLLDDLIQGISTKSGVTFNNWITTVFDVDAFLKGCAFNAVLAQWDDFCKNANNYYLLYRPTDQKWEFIPYDLDHTFETGHASDGVVSWVEYAHADDANADIELARKIMANLVWKAQYEQHVRDLTDPVGTLFTPAAIESRANAMRSAIGTVGTPVWDAVETSSYDPSSTPVTALKDWAASRMVQVISEVGTNGGSGGYDKNYAMIYLRGDFNGWAIPGVSMTLVTNNTWNTSVSMTNIDTFKFSSAIDWSGNNWGMVGQVLSQTSGTCSTSGAENITNYQPTGTVTVSFNDSDLSWSVTQ